MSIAIILFLIFCSASKWPTSNAQLTTPPSPVTAQIGDDVTLTCGVSGEVYTEWWEYITNPVGAKIYQSTVGIVGDANKYGIEGTHNLIVKNLEFADGGFYGCNVEGLEEPARADIVVMEMPMASSGVLIEGEMNQLSCSTRFMSPTVDVVDPLHVPKAEAYIDPSNKFTSYEITATDGFYTISINVNYTALTSDHGKNWTCRTFTEAPVYEDYGTMALNVQYVVRNLELTLKNTFYYVGEHINCSAEGNPQPDIQWVPIFSSGARPITEPTLDITMNMIGENSWKCQVSNTVKELVSLDETITFDVVEDDTGEGEGGGNDGTTQAWAIAIGVIIPLVVIGLLIVAVAVFWKKRMAPTNNPPATKGTAERTRTRTTPPDVYSNTNPTFQEESFYDEADTNGYYPGYAELPTQLQMPPSAAAQPRHERGRPPGSSPFYPTHHVAPPHQPEAVQPVPFSSYQNEAYGVGRHQPQSGKPVQRDSAGSYPQRMTYDVSNVGSSRTSLAAINPFAYHPGFVNMERENERKKRQEQFGNSRDRSQSAGSMGGETTI